MSPLATATEMDFSRETFAAFSDALAALYTAPDRDGRIASLLSQLRPLFGGCEISIPEVALIDRAEVEPGATIRQRSRQATPATVGSENGIAATETIIVPIAGTPLRLILRRNEGFSAHERFLAAQLRAHLAAALGGQRVAPAGKSRRPADPAHLRGLGLTRRECEVLHWIIQGKRDAEIASILGAAPRTVNKHVENILAKLGVETRLAAARLAADWLARRSPKSW